MHSTYKQSNTISKADDDYQYWWNHHVSSVTPTLLPSYMVTSTYPSVAARRSATPSNNPSRYSTQSPTQLASRSSSSIQFPASAYFAGDGWCDTGQFTSLENLNAEVFAYDGGDCCEEECLNNPSRKFECGVSGYACLNRLKQIQNSSLIYSVGVGNISAEAIDVAKLILQVGIDSLFKRPSTPFLMSLEYQSITLEKKVSRQTQPIIHSLYGYLDVYPSNMKTTVAVRMDVAMSLQSSTLNSTLIHSYATNVLDRAVLDGILQRNSRYYAGRYFQSSLLWITICKECSSSYNDGGFNDGAQSDCGDALLSSSSIAWSYIYGESKWFPLYIVVLLMLWLALLVWAVRKYCIMRQCERGRGSTTYLTEACVFVVLSTRLIYWTLMLVLSQSMWTDAYCNEILYFNSQSTGHAILNYLHITVYNCMVIIVISALCKPKEKALLLTIPLIMIIYSCIEFILCISKVRTSEGFSNAIAVVQVICGSLLLSISTLQIIRPNTDSRSCSNIIARVVIIVYGTDIIGTTFNTIRYSPLLYLLFHTCLLYLLDIIIIMWILAKPQLNQEYVLVEHDTSPTINQHILPINIENQNRARQESIAFSEQGAPLNIKRSSAVSDRIFNTQTGDQQWISHWGSCLQDENT